MAVHTRTEETILSGGHKTTMTGEGIKATGWGSTPQESQAAAQADYSRQVQQRSNDTKKGSKS